MISYPVDYILSSLFQKYNIREISYRGENNNYFDPKVSSFETISNKDYLPAHYYSGDCLYFFSDYSLCENIPDGMNIIVVDDSPEIHRKKYGKAEYCAVVGSSEDSLGIVNDIHMVLSDIRNKMGMLMLSIANFSPAQSIVNQLSEIFRANVFVADNNGQPLYVSKDSLCFFADNSESSMRMAVKEILSDLNNREVNNLPSDYSPMKCLTAAEFSYIALPLILGDRKAGKLIVFGNSAEINAHHVSLGYIVCEQVKHLAGCFFESTHMSSQNTLRTLLASLLRNETVNTENLISALNKNGLELTGEYRLILLNYVGKNKSMPQPDVLDINIGKCIAVPYSSSVYAVLAYGDDVRDLSAINARLERSLIPHNWEIRAGLVFYNLVRLSDQFLLLSSLDISGISDKRRYYVEEHLGEILVMAINLFIPSDTVCHPSVLKLKMHDENAGTEFVKTLMSYLINNKSLSQSAKELFIHKNTMSYRLNAINEIAKIEYDEPLERLHILLSCILCVHTHDMKS